MTFELPKLNKEDIRNRNTAPEKYNKSYMNVSNMIIHV